MKIRVLGAHNCDSRDKKLVTLLIDDVLALEAASLTSSLSFREQQNIKAVFITHRHYDHLRDIPALGMNLFLSQKNVRLYGSADVYNALKSYLVNGDIYPAFLNSRTENPVLIFHEVVPYQTQEVEEYRIKAVPVNHSVPTLGYQITSKDDKSVFYTGDTGMDFIGVWQNVNPQLLITEVTAPDRYEISVGSNKHLTPRLLREALLSFKEIRGYLPRVLLVHMNPFLEDEIRQEIEKVSSSLDTEIHLAYEGMDLIF